MDTIHRLLFSLCDLLLRFLVYATATTTVLVLVLGNRADVKQTIVASGAYEKFIPSIVESNKSNTSIPFSDPEVARIISESFPPEKLQQETEVFVDSVFNWLEEDASSVVFTVDFTDNKTMLGDKLSQYAFTSLAFKEQCSIQPEAFNPFTATCRPFAYDIFQGEKDFAEQLKSSDDLLGSMVYSERDLPKSDTGKSIFDEYYYAPFVYTWLLKAPLILGTLTILSAVGYVVYLPNKRKGATKLGRRLVISSLTLIATPLLFSVVLPYVMNGYGDNKGVISTEVLLSDIFDTVVNNFDRMMITFGTWLLLIGLAVILGEKMTRPRTRYVGAEKHSGLTSSHESRKSLSSPRGKLNASTVPLISSEVSSTKKPRKPRKNSKYSKIPL